MMLVASMGKTEQTASGAGWAILMPLSMIGGAMVPTFVMPAWMQSIGFISPIRWAMLAIEGGVWRNFSLARDGDAVRDPHRVGIVCFAIGTRGLRKRKQPRRPKPVRPERLRDLRDRSGY